MDVRYGRKKLSWPLFLILAIVVTGMMFAALFGVAYVITKVCEYL